MQAKDIQTYYQESFNFLQLRKRRQAEQLKLLSNLRRGEQNISSTLMITLFDRIMSNTYDDKIQVKFLPSQGISQEQINSYNILATSDYQEMSKAKLDYDWNWDALFFGRGYMETVRFDTKRKIMQPHVINPLVFGYDPYIEEIQGWRYYWKWITKSKNDLKLLAKANVFTSDFNLETLPSGIDPYLWQYKITRDQARDGVVPPIETVNSDVYQILEFYGINDDGVKCCYWTDKNFAKIIYMKELDLKDGDELIMPDGTTVKKNSNWPIVVKESFRVPHSSLPISVADLLEDKHRAKAVLLNLAYVAAKDQANPLYWYNDNVTDQSAFLSRQVNQHIKVEGDGTMAVGPIQKASAMTSDLMSFIQMMDAEAESPIGAGRPMQASGGSTKQTATQAALDQQLNDVAQSLQGKVMQFGESEFWAQWFHRYAQHAEDLKFKMANIVGVNGVNSQIIDLKDFNTDYPPGVMVYSAKEAEYKNLVKRRDFMQMYPNLYASIGPQGMRNFNKHVFFPLFLEDPSLVDIIFPKTMDEMKSESENQQLKDGIMPDVSPQDDHGTHIYQHMMLQPKTWATWNHIQWHQELLDQQTKQQQAMGGPASNGLPITPQVREAINFKDLPPEGQQQMASRVGISISGGQSTVDNQNAQAQNGGQQASPQKPTVGAQMKNPLEAAVPLKGAMQPH